jgi:hypothetical protein
MHMVLNSSPKLDCGHSQAGTAHGIFGESDCAKTCQSAKPEVTICRSFWTLRCVTWCMHLAQFVKVHAVTMR